MGVVVLSTASFQLLDLTYCFVLVVLTNFVATTRWLAQCPILVPLHSNHILTVWTNIAKEGGTPGNAFRPRQTRLVLSQTIGTELNRLHVSSLTKMEREFSSLVYVWQPLARIPMLIVQPVPAPSLRNRAVVHSPGTGSLSSTPSRRGLSRGMRMCSIDGELTPLVGGD